MDSKLIGAVLVTAVIVGGGGFYGGMKYDQAHPTVSANARTGGMGARGGFGNGQGRGGAAGMMGGSAAGGFTAGSILSKDANTLTLQLRDGGSKIVLYSTSTRVGKMTDGTVADLTPGTEVTVMGAANADGSITASQVQIRPAGQPDQFPGRGGRAIQP